MPLSLLLCFIQVSQSQVPTQSHTVTCALLQRFGIQLSPAEYPKFVALLHLNFGCLSLTTYLRSKYFAEASCLPHLESELVHRFKCRVICRATLLKMTWLALALHLAFSFVFSRRSMTAGNLSVHASFGSWLKLTCHFHYFSSR